MREGGGLTQVSESTQREPPGGGQGEKRKASKRTAPRQVFRKMPRSERVGRGGKSERNVGKVEAKHAQESYEHRGVTVSQGGKETLKRESESVWRNRRTRRDTKAE